MSLARSIRTSQMVMVAVVVAVAAMDARQAAPARPAASKAAAILTWPVAQREQYIAALDAFFLLYAEAYQRNRKPFVDWVREDYDEAALRRSFRARPWADLLVDRVLRRE